MSASVTWFRRPSEGQPGTLNATYQLLDRAVVLGRAEQTAMDALDHATLLERVGAFGGVLRGFGVVPGDRVLADLPDGEDLAVTLLATVRLGAVAVVLPQGSPDVGAAVDATGPRVVVTDDDVAVGLALADTEHQPDALVVRGASAGVAVPWDVVMRAGRTDPAGVADLAPEAPAVVVWPAPGEERATVRLTGDLAERLAALEAPYDAGALLEAFRGA